MKLAFIIQVPFITNTSDILQSSIYIAQTFSRVTKAHDGSDNAYCSVNFVKKDITSQVYVIINVQKNLAFLKAIWQ